MYQVVLDTNVIASALLSKAGASYKILMQLNQSNFEINLSVPLLLEYEYTLTKLLPRIALTKQDIHHILDFIKASANLWEIHFLLRPTLQDPNDEMVLELAFAAHCDFIVTQNNKDFKNVTKQYGIQIISPYDFLQLIQREDKT